MARRNVLAGNEIPVKASLRGLKYESVDQVKFTFKRADDSVAMSCDAKVTERKFRANVYTGKVNAADPKDDEILFDVTCFLEVAATSEKRLIEELRIWRKQLLVKAVDAATGDPAKGASLIVEGGSEKALPVTEANGEVLVDIEFREHLNILWQPPWRLNEWVTKTGSAWEAKLDYRFVADIANVALGADMEQWVLRDAKLGDDCGTKAKVKVVGGEGFGRAGDKVYLKAHPTNKPLVEENKALDDKLQATFEIDVGDQVGDFCSVEVGTTPECTDDRARIVNKHFTAKIVFPYKPPKGPASQFVRKHKSEGAECGQKITVRVGTVDDKGRKGDKVYLKITKNDGAVEEKNAELEGNLEASFEIDLGDVGGHVTKLEAGSTADCKDDTVSVRNVTFEARLVYPPSKASKHKHWVNLPSANDKPDQGYKMKVKVESNQDDGLPSGGKTDKVYLRATFDSGNNDRTPDVPDGNAKNSVLEKEIDLDDWGEGETEVNVGHAGGDKVTIEIGFDKTYGDDKADIETWRKLFYELCYPDVMKLTDADFPKKTKDFFTRVLDLAFVKYEKHSASTYTPAANTLYDAKFVGESGKAKRVVLGKADSPGVFTSNDTRTIKVTACDDAYSGKGDVATVRPDNITSRTVKIDVRAVAKKYTFPRRMDSAGGSGFHSGTWTAEVTSADYATHAGLSAGNPRTGAIKEAWVKWLDYGTVQVEFPKTEAPGTFIGNLGSKTCPVKLELKVYTAHGINGSAGSGAQLLVIKPKAPESMAATCCHELGHAMGQAVMPTSVSFKKKATPGVDPPDTVDDDPKGFVYDEHGHVGTHCAHGLTVAQRGAAKYSDYNGDCILFGSGGSTDPPDRNEYCAECKAQIKARKLQDIHASWKDRVAADL